MSSINLKSLISQVKTNCNISDAKFWGYYSVCGLLLRFRELYRKENYIIPWERIPQKDIVEWISDREKLWQDIEDKDFNDIIIDGHVYGPFQVEKINTALEKEDLIYGAGYGTYMKPSFYLAELISKQVIKGYEVYISGNEFARDLAAYPAMLQGSTIFARRDALSIILWDKFEEMKLRKQKSALSYAFSHYGVNPEDQVSEDVYYKVLNIASIELDTYIYHEIGEAFEGERLGGKWKKMLSEIKNRRVEFFIRGIKDVLSDTSDRGMIMQIIEKGKKGSIGFYISLLGGFRKMIFPEIIDAFKDFSEMDNWAIIEKARKEGYKRAEELAERVLSIYNSETDNTKINEIIEKELICKITG